MEESAHANIIQHSPVEFRRNIRHVVCSVNVHWADGFTDSICQRFNLEWQSALSESLRKRIDITLVFLHLTGRQ